MKNTVATFRQAKGQTSLSMITAYDYSIAKIAEQSDINGILVGDSLGMVMLGYQDTLRVTLEDMISSCAAVARAVHEKLLVCDMPFMSYHTGVHTAVKNAGRLVQEGLAQAVKLEGGCEFLSEVAAIVRAQIPVMGHLGLTPQSVNAFGGFKVQGKSVEAAQKILDSARALQDAGIFAIVLEGIPALLGEKITQELEVPTIGIGAGSMCDGQILVWQDMLGLTERQPKFVKPFANLRETILHAFKDYTQSLQDHTFPSAEHCYTVENEAEIIAQLK
ncbi:MAG: 3-methyl-2-oxobutanoate hydroxymethyltransferase [Desulfovibrionaceae bacterium]|nr:3-methyl-2-oxobutanoate hydroxymethyltransferase [Desulfovibrionaceae bacterium]